MFQPIIEDIQASLLTIKASRAIDLEILTEILDVFGLNESIVLLDDEIDELKGHFSAKAANLVPDEETADAILAVEKWIAENISNGSRENQVAATLILKDASCLVTEWLGQYQPC